MDRHAENSHILGASRHAKDLVEVTSPDSDFSSEGQLTPWENYNYGTNLMFRYIEISLRSNSAALFIAGGILIYALANEIDATVKTFALLIPLSICALCTIYNGYSVYQSYNFTRLAKVRDQLELSVGLDYLLLTRISLLSAIIHFIAFVVILRLITLL